MSIWSESILMFLIYFSEGIVLWFRIVVKDRAAAILVLGTYQIHLITYIQLVFYKLPKKVEFIKIFEQRQPPEVLYKKRCS